MKFHETVCACCLVLIACVATADDAAPGNQWSLEVGEDPNSGAMVASLQQDSSNSIKDESASNDIVPRLSFQCKPGESAATARIDWGRFISSFKTEIGFKVDDGKRTWLKWGVDRSEKVTISPSTGDTAKLISLMSDGSNLEVEISPYSASPVTVQYNLSEFAEGMQQLLASCQ